MRVFLLITVGVLFVLSSCQKEINRLGKTNKGLLPTLSKYGIFQGTLADLNPSTDFRLYDIATPLFSDYSEKQRLIHLPQGKTLKPLGDELPEFPDGTILVKTFFYFRDKRDTSKGKRIMETRILLKQDSKWNVGTYIWNPEQNEATLFNSGLNETVNWIDEEGKAKVISYRVPDKNSCITCHQNTESILPLGLKIRNLNINVTRNKTSLNQLVHLQNEGLMEVAEPSAFSVLPDWSDTTRSLEERSRAYLDINCSHCHNSKGNASGSNLFMNYDFPEEESRVEARAETIINEIERKRMPKLGTSVIDEEGLKLLKSYLLKQE